MRRFIYTSLSTWNLPVALVPQPQGLDNYDGKAFCQLITHMKAVRHHHHVLSGRQALHDVWGRAFVGQRFGRAACMPHACVV